MKAELRTKWVDALRSGQFAQGGGLLYNHNNDTYCCIGVLCTLLGMEKGSDGEACFKGDFDWRTVGGLSVDMTSRLAHLNDGGKSFEQIAEYIEANVPVSLVNEGALK